MSAAEASTKEPREFARNLRMGRSFHDWLNRFAAAQRTDSAKLMEQGLALLAKARKFEPPPAR